MSIFAILSERIVTFQEIRNVMKKNVDRTSRTYSIMPDT